METRDISITLTADTITLEASTSKKKNTEISSSIKFDPVAVQCVERLHYWLNYSLERLNISFGQDKPCELTDLRTIGLLLHNMLFNDQELKKIKDLFTTAYEDFVRDYEAASAAVSHPNLRLRLHLNMDKAAPEIAALPWELLFIPGEDDINNGFFFSGEKAELILTRYSPNVALEQRLKPEDVALRILVIFSNPIDTAQMDPKEVKQLLDLFEGLRTTNRVETTIAQNVGYTTLGTLISKVKPHVVHYIGHGDAGKLVLCKERSEPDYDLERKDKLQPRWVSGDQFKSLFNQHKPRLVFLNACKGAATPRFNEGLNSLRGLNSVAKDLVTALIPAVVAMQYNISNGDAVDFAREFYARLGAGDSIDEAVKSGRIVLSGIWPGREHPRFCTPVLYLLCQNAIVIPPRRDESATELYKDSNSRISKDPSAVTPAGLESIRTPSPSNPGVTTPLEHARPSVDQPPSYVSSVDSGVRVAAPASVPSSVQPPADVAPPSPRQ